MRESTNTNKNLNLNSNTNIDTSMIHQQTQFKKKMGIVFKQFSEEEGEGV